MAKILFWYDPRVYTFMDRCASFYGFETIVIDPDHVFSRESLLSADTLEEAEAMLSDHEWVWMCADGEVYLDEFAHPAGDKVVYAFGHNVDGMGPEFTDRVGSKVSIRTTDKIFDYQVAHEVGYDRMLYRLGRRA